MLQITAEESWLPEGTASELGPSIKDRAVINCQHGPFCSLPAHIAFPFTSTILPLEITLLTSTLLPLKRQRWFWPGGSTSSHGHTARVTTRRLYNSLSPMSLADPLHLFLHCKAFAKQGEAVWIPLGTYVQGFPSPAAVLASPLQSLRRVTSANWSCPVGP